jgi:hypothetical protein
MGETMHSNIRVGAEFKSKEIMECDLQYAERGQEGDDAITTVLIPDIKEDKTRGHDESSLIVEKTIDTAFDGQMHDCDKISIDDVALDKNKRSPAKQFRDLFENKYTQPGAVDFLIASGRPGILHNPLGAKIDKDFMAANYSFLKEEESKVQIKYQLQEDGSVIIINEFFGEYLDNGKAFDYSNYRFDLKDSKIPVDQKTPKPQTNRINTCITYKLEMKNGEPQLSIIYRQFSIESENIQEANTMGRLLAEKMKFDFVPIVEKTPQITPRNAAPQPKKETTDLSKERIGFVSLAINFIKKLVLSVLFKPSSKEPVTSSPTKSAGQAFFSPTTDKKKNKWDLSNATEPVKPAAQTVMPMTESYKGAGFLNGNNDASKISSEANQVTKSIILGHK